MSCWVNLSSDPMSDATAHTYIDKRGRKRFKFVITINLVQLELNLQLILNFNLENFAQKSTLIIVTTGIAMIHRPLRLCMYNITHGFFTQFFCLYACD